MRIFFLFLIVIGLEAKEYKVIFDCSSGDMGYLKSRMWLIGKTIDMFQKRGDNLQVVLTMHGKCSILASEDFDMYIRKEEVQKAKTAQEFLQLLLKRKNFKAFVCAMSLDANDIDKESIMERIKISPNSFTETIRYQNEGYAIMTFK